MLNNLFIYAHFYLLLLLFFIMSQIWKKKCALSFLYYSKECYDMLLFPCPWNVPCFSVCYFNTKCSVYVTDRGEAQIGVSCKWGHVGSWLVGKNCKLTRLMTACEWNVTATMGKLLVSKSFIYSRSLTETKISFTRQTLTEQTAYKPSLWAGHTKQSPCTY